MGTRIQIQGARISYPHLVTPRAVKAGDTPKYGVALLVPKNNPAIAQIQQANLAEKGAKWGANVPPTAKDVPMYDGDTDPKYNTNVENHGCMILSCNSQDAVPCIGPDGATPIGPDALYAGSYCNAFVDIYTYVGDLSKGCAFGLVALQFTMDGERIDGRPDPTTLFAPVAGAPAPVAPGVVPPQQPAYQPPAPPAHGAPVAPAPVAPAPAGTPPVGNPAFLG